MLRQCCLATLMAQVKGERGRGGLASLNSSYKCLRDFLLIALLHTLLVTIKTPAPLPQVGAWVPATSLRLHPADAIFVRMGARDNIMAGQSTFYVELAETASMLHKASSR